MESSVRTLRGRSLHVARQGERGRTAILVHGAAAHSGQWRGFAERFGEGRRVLAPDLHGYGRSDPAPPDGHPALIHDAALLADLVLDAGAEGDPPDLIGFGLGAQAALRVASQQPDALSSLVLIEPHAFQLLDEVDDPRRLEALDLAVAVMTLSAYGETEAAARRYVDFWRGEGAFDAAAEETRAYVLAVAERLADDCRAGAAAAPGQIFIEEVRRVAAPTAIICGQRARPCVRAVAARLRAALPGARYQELSGDAPLSPDAAPDALATAVRAALDDL